MTALPRGYVLREGADPVAAHAFLTHSYWAMDISLEKVTRALENSFALSVCHDATQVAMVRVISDEATFAYLTDVYVEETHRGKGLSKAMLRHLLDLPRYQGILRWTLFTKDAQSLYRQFGWSEYPMPERTMVIDKRVQAG